MSLLIARDLAIAGRLEPTSLDLAGGQLTCLIGPNGSGKTSLLHALAGIGGARGTVRVGDVDPATVGPDVRQRLLTFLPASRDVKWPLKAADLIAMGGGAAEAVVAELDLSDLLQRRVDRLSTGERSRVLIARALVAEPRILLLDEAVANLDPLWQIRLMDYLKRLSRDAGRAVLLAVHDLDVAGAYADRLLIMSGGRVAADGDPDSLLAGAEMAKIFGVERVAGRWRPA